MQDMIFTLKFKLVLLMFVVYIRKYMSMKRSQENPQTPVVTTVNHMIFSFFCKVGLSCKLCQILRTAIQSSVVSDSTMIPFTKNTEACRMPNFCGLRVKKYYATPAITASIQMQTVPCHITFSKRLI